MAIGSNPLSSTRKSGRSDVISYATGQHDISVACRAKNRFQWSALRFSGRFLARLAESFWRQISVSKVAVCYMSTTALDFRTALSIGECPPKAAPCDRA